MKIAQERLVGLDGDYDPETVKHRLHELSKCDYAHSIYGSTVSPSSLHSSSSSQSSILAAKRTEAAAELAAKEAEYEGKLKEEMQRQRIQRLEEQQKRELLDQKGELDRLKAEADIRAARARLEVYNQEVNVHSYDYETKTYERVFLERPVQSTPGQHHSKALPASPPPPADVSFLAQALQDSIALNRLPMPEPTVFSGDPIQFNEWKASFVSLIDRKNISSAEKLHYLRRYVSGEARKTLEGIFYRDDDDAYKDAWLRLNHSISHRLHRCPNFRRTSLDERREFVKDKRLCFGCLKPGHSAKECHRKHICDNCKGRHPTQLHDDNFCKGKPKLVSPQPDMETATTQSLHTRTEDSSIHTSMIVPVWISLSHNPVTEKLVYALLDTQSDTVFIDEEVGHSLQAETQPVKLKMTTMMGRDEVMNSERITGLRVRGYNSSTYIDLPPAYSRDCIPISRAHIPTCETARQWNHLQQIAQEIPPPLKCDVGLLIGYNCSQALAPRQVILGGDNEPYAVRTDLGWSVVGGSSFHNKSGINSICHRVAVKEHPPVTPLDVIKVLESDFKDTDKSENSFCQDDILFLNIMRENISKNDQGHYEMPLPFKERPHLPNNRQLAVVRLGHLKKKLLRDEMYKEHYVKFMSEVIDRGDAEEVHQGGKEGERWYIPHHGVYHAKKPSKLRVVFDCSARYQGTSLNEHLLRGPDLMNSLIGILLRFRQHHIAVMSDVEKMFHQFHVPEPDRDYLRFLWWKNGDLTAEPSEYRMKVHLFGAASSPGCANYGLKHLAKENQGQFPLGSQYIMKDFYVDDGVTSVADASQAVQLAQEATQLCALGGLRLHKFVSNSKLVLESLPQSECAIHLQDLDLNLNEPKTERALGIHWHPESDTLRFQNYLKGQPESRRGILSTVASIYDPLGLIAPVLLVGKRVLQETCKRGISWDEPLVSPLQATWEQWKGELNRLNSISVARCFIPSDFGHTVKRELHHFSDASTYGYGQCSYLRLLNDAGDVHCTLIMAKSRVAPIKVVTVPRLELTAAVVSVSISHILKEELDLEGAEEYFWTDSKVVLGYINNEARRFHTFVSNRVQKIRLMTSPQQWRYISSEENPADLASRGSTADQLVTSGWFSGPQFLWQRELPPEIEFIPDVQIGDPEVKGVQPLNVQCTEQTNLLEKLSKFSSWSKVTQAIARLIRRAKGDTSTDLSTVQEREEAKCLIIQRLQVQEYSQEIHKTLKRGILLSPQSQLYKFDAFLDQDGILKVGGRLRNSSLPTFQKHPTLLPKNHHITKLIIAHYHSTIKHQGKGMTMNEIRANGYWIPGLNGTVASLIHHCVTCRKLRGSTEEQRMADLPSERLDPSPPFTYCGMDCFGPFLTKQGRKTNKRYGLLFTCLYSRAIHIEMLVDMSSDAFINALRCFIALRGTVRQIRCDHGSNFVGAKHELTQALKELDCNRLATYLAERQCDFKMNAPHASHAGGVWERQIRTVRNVLSATLSLSSNRLDDSSLRTFFYEAMFIVNSRPLTVENLSDPNSLEPLTPNHLITMKSSVALPPPGKFIKEDMYARKR
ncbi:uncharacterized protein LOC128765925 isoform X1 [Synchiropus splendidus]|uniref:uncharacterized protein LOC128765925 isoform X1 n=1 Tax=Synchiropus splendidus TaxID=270530 RepID=UPI00237EAEC0|nr:uncharacterized protein LOC128765925 isoform X1 [Synchiropus splendidus]